MLPIQQTIWMSLSTSNLTCWRPSQQHPPRPTHLFVFSVQLMAPLSTRRCKLYCHPWNESSFLISHIQFSSRICQFCFLHIPQICLDSSHVPSLVIWTTAIDSFLISLCFLFPSFSMFYILLIPPPLFFSGFSSFATSLEKFFLIFLGWLNPSIISDQSPQYLMSLAHKTGLMLH